MKKTLGKVTRLVIVAVMATGIFLSGTFAFAVEEPETTGAPIVTENLVLEDSSPEPGAKGIPIENVGIKLFFDGNVTADDVWKANEKCFTLTDKKGKEVKVKAYADSAQEDYILVIAQPKSAKKNVSGKLKPKSNYTLTIDSGLTSADGKSLAKDIDIKFTTVDISKNSKISMYLMFGMVIAIAGLMFLNNKRKEHAKLQMKLLENADPYKVAKDKGISVAEANVQIAKAKSKHQKNLDKLGPSFADMMKPPEEVAKELEAKKKNVHKVHTKKPISAAGGKYKSGKKAIAEKKAAEEKRKAAAKARAKAKSSGGKKGKKK
ncbi:MAG: Ig-like domain-containing protein [Clostridiales Family XIII bacterium]|nr:Ig-like domain-containing protein [Clostridiales Family XIII bacterium]